MSARVPPQQAEKSELEQTSEGLRSAVKNWWTVLAPIAGAVGSALAALRIPDATAKALAWVVTFALVGAALAIAQRAARAKKLAAERQHRIEEFKKERGIRTSFRGLNGFADGDFPPGPQRRRDAETIFAQVSSREFAFGVVSGDIGAGKTSLLHAGLVKLIRTGGFEVAILSSPSDMWQTEGANRLKIDAVIERLDKWLRKTFPSADKPRVVIIDQFEEFFIRFHNKSDRVRLARFLKSLMTGPPPVRLLCAVRREFFVDFRDFAPEFDLFFCAKYVSDPQFRSC